MADIEGYFSSMRIEKFENYKKDSNLSKFDSSENMVIFFDLENNVQINQYIKNQFLELKNNFSEVGKNFIYLADLDYPENTRDFLKFYLPYLSTSDLKQFYSEKHISLTFMKQMTELFNEISNVSVFQDEHKSILNYLGYKGDIKCGLIFFDNYSTSVLEFNDFFVKDNTEGLFNDLIAFFKKVKEEIGEYDAIIGDNYSYDPYENLDEDAKEKILEIQIQLKELRDSGQLLFALPVLKDILNKEANKINLDTTNNIVISSDYRIVLTHFDNLEIQLSHLTKVVYVLFYENPCGINIKELHKYRKQLEDLYSSISNQLDYDKMMQSIEDLVNPESKAIYTHISRIKSAFYKQMDHIYARNYIVAGDSFGDDFKYISILRPNFNYDILSDPEFDV